jgi:hypothetical protein
MLNSIDNLQFFKQLDRLFWLAWIALPVVMWLTYSSLVDQSVLRAELPPEAAKCADILPQITNFSSAGKAALLVYFLVQYAVYAWLMYLSHSAIHLCATGRAFVSSTLNTLKQLGMIVVVWPFVDLAASNVIKYALTLTGDLKVFHLDFLFDVGTFGVGLLLLTLGAILRHAIRLKQDHDLTI